MRLELFNSALGRAGTVTRSVAARGTTLTLSVAELKLTGVDPKRMVLRTPHEGNRLGRRVAWTTTGSLRFDVQDETLDVFLMDNRRTADYTCFDSGDFAWLNYGFRERYTTLRKAVGEILFDNYLAEDGSDTPFEWASQQFTAALNPFGLPFGSVTFTRGSGAAMVGGWWYGFDPTAIGMARQGGGVFWIAAGLDPARAEEVTIHELAHAYLGAPDYYKHPECMGLRGVLMEWGDGDWVLSARGEDAVRYWSLMGLSE